MGSESLKYEFLDEETKSDMHEESADYINKFIRIGEKKYFIQKTFVEQREAFLNFKIRSSDVWITGLPRSGTTLTQEMVWLLQNNLDYDSALKYKLDSRFSFFDLSLFYPQHPLEEPCNMSESEEEKVKALAREGKSTPEILAAYPSPRHIKSHLPLDMLPNDLLDSDCKIVYVARNPKDHAVSYYHFRKNIMDVFKYNGDFKAFWNLYTKNLILYTPYWEHLKEAWKRRNHPNFLFLFYEEMNNDLSKVIDKVAKFLGKDYSSEEIVKLVDHLSIKNFRNNKSVNHNNSENVTILKKNTFIRKGQVGGWKDEFTPELEAEADEWINENLKDTDLKFPFHM